MQPAARRMLPVLLAARLLPAALLLLAGIPLLAGGIGRGADLASRRRAA